MWPSTTLLQAGRLHEWGCTFVTHHLLRCALAQPVLACSFKWVSLFLVEAILEHDTIANVFQSGQPVYVWLGPNAKCLLACVCMADLWPVMEARTITSSNIWTLKGGGMHEGG